MHRHLSVAAALLGAALVAGCAGQGAPTGEAQVALISISQADADADRRVTCEEWQAFYRDTFARVDLDRSGYLDRREFDRFSAATGSFYHVPVSAIDTSGDHLLSLDEVTEAGLKEFKARDGNGDCALTAGEVAPPTYEPPEPRPRIWPPLEPPPA